MTDKEKDTCSENEQLDSSALESCNNESTSEIATENPDTSVAKKEESVNIEQTFDWSVSESIEPKKEKKKKKGISARVFSATLVVSMLASFALAFFAADINYKKKLEAQKQEIYDQIQSSDIYNYGNILDKIFTLFGYREYDRDEAIAAMLKGYISATGDKYATYYTKEEYEQQNSEDAGELVGIGVSVENNTINNGIEILNVYEDSPAMESGLCPGDIITHVKIDDEFVSIESLGFDMALEKVRGEEGTFVELRVLKGDDYTESVDLKIQRRKIVVMSVTGKVCTTDPKVGIVMITGFDYTTPAQFTQAVDKLIESGCDKFVLDVRGNPGGLLLSVNAVLSFFLEKGDKIVYTEDAFGVGTWDYVEPIYYSSYPYNMCNVSDEDIGKYKDLNVVVLANGSTASAGELFTATFKEYGYAKVVGVQTYGKGSMQTTYPLSRYGLEGAIKLTTHIYSPVSQVNYDGVGITPDIIVEMDEEFKRVNIYKLDHADDNQLQAAISTFYN